MDSGESYAEKLVDEAIVALLSENELFRVWLFDTCFPADAASPDRPEFVSAAASVWQGNGETDIVVKWKAGADRQFVLLIEDKLTASFQPAQGQRYADRVKELRAQGVNCRSLLMAPEGYLAGANPESRFFDGSLPLERVVTAAAECSGEECPRADVLRRTCDRVNAGGVLGAKGLHPDIHELIAVECGRQGTGFRVNNNATDWVFFAHPELIPGIEMRYRIAQGWVEIAFTSAFRGDRTSIMSHVRPPLVSDASKGHRFVRVLGISEPIPGERRPSFDRMDAARVVHGLELLMNWLKSYLPASQGSPEDGA